MLSLFAAALHLASKDLSLFRWTRNIDLSGYDRMPLKFGKSFGNFLVENVIVITLLQSQIVRIYGAEFRSLTFDREPNFFMDGKVLRSSFVYDAFACQLLCIRELECSSFNFENQAGDKDGNHLCELLDKVKIKNRLVPSGRFDFYSVIPKCKYIRS